MRIAHITATFPPHLTGTGLVCFHNAVELTSQGHEVHVFTAALHNAAPVETYKGIEIHRIKPIVQVGNAPFLPQLLTHLRDFELLHLHYPFFGGEITALASRVYRTPLVITYHNDVHLHGLIGLAERSLRNTIGRITLRTAEKILFTSQDYGQASYIRNFLPNNQEVIGELPNGVDVEFFTPGLVPEKLRQQFAFDQNDRLALLVAGLDEAHYFKGAELFIQAILELPSQNKGIIVGDGNLKPVYEQKARELGGQDRIHFAGRVAESDLPDFYRLADVTVLPSITMGEAFGLVLVESLACGTPVIASNLPGVRTVVANGVDGYLVQPGDVNNLRCTLEQILSLPSETRHAMGMAGRRKVEQQYTWKLAGQRLDAIYRQVITSKKKQAITNNSGAV